MSLREKLEQLLPNLLPEREEAAIKGTELIARVREVLGPSYSDHSLRSQFSFMALDPASCLARIPNGQGYYLRGHGEDSSLHRLFEEDPAAFREGESPSRKLLALAVRLYDTLGQGVFAYPDEEEPGMFHPDLATVQWPAGHWDAQGAYVLDDRESPPSFRAVCIAFCPDEESARQAFFRALSCGLWAEESELLVIGETQGLSQLGLQFGVGIRGLGHDVSQLRHVPGANTLFRADSAAARDWLNLLPQETVCLPRRRCPLPTERPDLAVVKNWAAQCVARGRIEPYEMRVAAH